jgi:hypothetical protein
VFTSFNNLKPQCDLCPFSSYMAGTLKLLFSPIFISSQQLASVCPYSYSSRDWPCDRLPGRQPCHRSTWQLVVIRGGGGGGGGVVSRWELWLLANKFLHVSCTLISLQNPK